MPPLPLPKKAHRLMDRLRRSVAPAAAPDPVTGPSPQAEARRADHGFALEVHLVAQQPALVGQDELNLAVRAGDRHAVERLDGCRGGRLSRGVPRHLLGGRARRFGAARGQNESGGPEQDSCAHGHGVFPCY